MILHMLHMPRNSGDSALAFSLHNVGGPRFWSVRATGIAVMTRAVLKTVGVWREGIRSLTSSAESLPLGFWAPLEPTLWPPFWDSCAFVVELQKAAIGKSFALTKGLHSGCLVEQERSGQLKGSVQAAVLEDMSSRSRSHFGSRE